VVVVVVAVRGGRGTDRAARERPPTAAAGVATSDRQRGVGAKAPDRVSRGPDEAATNAMKSWGVAVWGVSKIPPDGEEVTALVVGGGGSSWR